MKVLTDFRRLRKIVEDLGVDVDEATLERIDSLRRGEVTTGQGDVIPTRSGMFEGSATMPGSRSGVRSDGMLSGGAS